MAEKEKLLSTMDVLRQKTQPKSSLLMAEAERPPFTWKNVITEVQTASDSYRKTLFARMCEKSGVFEQWLTLLPDGTYASTISGAFIMGVQVCNN